MSVTSKCFLLLLSIAVASGVDKDSGRFDPGPITSFPNRQTVSKLTIGARAIETDEQARPAFGKLNPYKKGILPVLLIVQNDGNQTLSLERMRVEYITAKRSRIEATPADEVRYTTAPRRPGPGVPYPRIPGIGRGKNPLDTWEIEGRAFAAKMLPPGQLASGFVYFQTGHTSGSVLYVTGIREAATGKELFYLEIPLEKVQD